eukprot:GILJ01014797.1.p1 GENE.GILJ01014797.1~~GILJ01014797.1.p1  ORF type:complete len:2225 (-),score=290.49 GILJ01014797.1:119-6757(-)
MSVRPPIVLSLLELPTKALFLVLGFSGSMVSLPLYLSIGSCQPLVLAPKQVASNVLAWLLRLLLVFFCLAIACVEVLGAGILVHRLAFAAEGHGIALVSSVSCSICVVGLLRIGFSALKKIAPFLPVPDMKLFRLMVVEAFLDLTASILTMVVMLLLVHARHLIGYNSTTNQKHKFTNFRHPYLMFVFYHLQLTILDYLCLPFALILFILPWRLRHLSRQWQTIEGIQRRQLVIKQSVLAFIDLPFFLLGVPVVLTVYRIRSLWIRLSAANINSRRVVFLVEFCELISDLPFVVMGVSILVSGFRTVALFRCIRECIGECTPESAVVIQNQSDPSSTPLSHNIVDFSVKLRKYVWRLFVATVVDIPVAMLSLLLLVTVYRAPETVKRIRTVLKRPASAGVSVPTNYRELLLFDFIILEQVEGLICDIPFILLSLINVICLWSVFEFVGKCLKSQSARNRRKLSVQIFCRNILDVICGLLLLVISISGCRLYRTIKMIKNNKPIKSEQPVSWFGYSMWHHAVLDSFIITFFDLPFILPFLIGCCNIFRLPSLIRGLIRCESVHLQRKMILKQIVISFLDILTVLSTVVLFVTLWRIPILIHKLKYGTFKNLSAVSNGSSNGTSGSAEDDEEEESDGPSGVLKATRNRLEPVIQPVTDQQRTNDQSLFENVFNLSPEPMVVPSSSVESVSNRPTATSQAGQESIMERWHIFVFDEMTQLLLDIPYIFCLLISILSPPRFVMSFYHAVTDMHSKKRRKYILRQFLLSFVDIFSIFFLLVDIVCFWRLPMLYDFYTAKDLASIELSRWHAAVFETFTTAIGDLPFIPFAVSLLVTVWRIPHVTRALLKLNSPWGQRKTVMKQFLYLLIDTVSLLLCLVVGVTVWRLPHLIRVIRELTPTRISPGQEYKLSNVLNWHKAVFTVFKEWILDLPYIPFVILNVICVWRVHLLKRKCDLATTNQQRRFSIFSNAILGLVDILAFLLAVVILLTGWRIPLLVYRWKNNHKNNSEKNNQKIDGSADKTPDGNGSQPPFKSIYKISYAPRNRQRLPPLSVSTISADICHGWWVSNWHCCVLRTFSEVLIDFIFLPFALVVVGTCYRLPVLVKRLRACRLESPWEERYLVVQQCIATILDVVCMTLCCFVLCFPWRIPTLLRIWNIHRFGTFQNGNENSNGSDHSSEPSVGSLPDSPRIISDSIFNISTAYRRKPAGATIVSGSTADSSTGSSPPSDLRTNNAASVDDISIREHHFIVGTWFVVCQIMLDLMYLPVLLLMIIAPWTYMTWVQQIYSQSESQSDSGADSYSHIKSESSRNRYLLNDHFKRGLRDWKCIMKTVLLSVTFWRLKTLFKKYASLSSREISFESKIECSVNATFDIWCMDLPYVGLYLFLYPIGLWRIRSLTRYLVADSETDSNKREKIVTTASSVIRDDYPCILIGLLLTVTVWRVPDVIRIIRQVDSEVNRPNNGRMKSRKSQLEYELNQLLLDLICLWKTVIIHVLILRVTHFYTRLAHLWKIERNLYEDLFWVGRVLRWYRKRKLNINKNDNISTNKSTNQTQPQPVHTILTLPVPMLCKIFEYQDIFSLVKISQISPQLRVTANTTRLWLQTYKHLLRVRHGLVIDPLIDPNTILQPVENIHGLEDTVTGMVETVDLHHLKKACKPLLSSRPRRPESTSDAAIGIRGIIHQEYRCSISLSPHLLLIPIKIISAVLYTVPCLFVFLQSKFSFYSVLNDFNNMSISYVHHIVACRKFDFYTVHSHFWLRLCAVFWLLLWMCVTLFNSAHILFFHLTSLGYKAPIPTGSPTDSQRKILMILQGVTLPIWPATVLLVGWFIWSHLMNLSWTRFILESIMLLIVNRAAWQSVPTLLATKYVLYRPLRMYVQLLNYARSGSAVVVNFTHQYLVAPTISALSRIAIRGYMYISEVIQKLLSKRGTFMKRLYKLIQVVISCFAHIKMFILLPVFLIWRLNQSILVGSVHVAIKGGKIGDLLFTPVCLVWMFWPCVIAWHFKSFYLLLPTSIVTVGLMRAGYLLVQEHWVSCDDTEVVELKSCQVQITNEQLSFIFKANKPSDFRLQKAFLYFSSEQEKKIWKCLSAVYGPLWTLYFRFVLYPIQLTPKYVDPKDFATNETDFAFALRITPHRFTNQIGSFEEEVVNILTKMKQVGGDPTFDLRIVYWNPKQQPRQKPLTGSGGTDNGRGVLFTVRAKPSLILSAHSLKANLF